MAENSKIEWTDHTFNPWTGCAKVSPGCDHCYAESWAKRSGAVRWGAGEPRRRTTEANWRLPIKWNAQAAREGRRYRVFCASLADVFDNEVPAEWLVDLLDVVRVTPSLDWLVLTKRIGNWRKRLEAALSLAYYTDRKVLAQWLAEWLDGHVSAPCNVWLGATVVNQEEADRDIPKLIATPAAKRFLSMEPLLGPVSLRWLAAWDGMATKPRSATETVTTDHLDGLRRLDWVIVGGESGHGARPMHPDWARHLRDQCAEAGVPFLFKQWGEHAPNWLNDDAGNKIPGSEWIDRMGKKAAGRELDGRRHDAFPEAA